MEVTKFKESLPFKEINLDVPVPADDKLMEIAKRLADPRIAGWNRERFDLLKLDHGPVGHAIAKLEGMVTQVCADRAMNGGIDFNQINIKRKGKTISVQFDQTQLNVLEQGGFKGFISVITGFKYIQSPFPLLGIHNPT